MAITLTPNVMAQVMGAVHVHPIGGDVVNYNTGPHHAEETPTVPKVVVASLRVLKHQNPVERVKNVAVGQRGKGRKSKGTAIKKLMEKRMLT